MLWSIVICVIFIAINNRQELITATKANWTYSWISFEGNTTNEDLFDWQIGLERISRDLFVVSGTLMINVDVTDDTTIQFTAYRSSSGSNDYVRLPIEVPKKPLMEYLNGVYKDTVMESLSNCTDFPHTDETVAQPLEKKTYEFSNCVFDTEKFPSHIMPGYYKVHILIYHPDVECFAEAVVKIDQKLI